MFQHQDAEKPSNDREPANPQYPPPDNGPDPSPEPQRTQSSSNGGTCGVWMVIGCFGVTLAVALIVFVGGIVYLISNQDDDSAAPAPTPVISEDPVTDDESQPDPMDPDAEVVSFGPGTVTVGEDIDPGIYFADEAEEFCYWERLAGFSGEFGDINDNQIVDDRAIVEILESDEGFSSERCGEWRSQPGDIRPDPNAPFGHGTFLVGDEIEPGRWQSEGSEEACYWVRLSGFTGEFDHIITNAFGQVEPIVEISPDDVGFHSAECGTWSRIED